MTAIQGLDGTTIPRTKHIVQELVIRLCGGFCPKPFLFRFGRFPL